MKILDSKGFRIHNKNSSGNSMKGGLKFPKVYSMFFFAASFLNPLHVCTVLDGDLNVPKRRFGVDTPNVEICDI